MPRKAATTRSSSTAIEAPLISTSCLFGLKFFTRIMFFVPFSNYCRNEPVFSYVAESFLEDKVDTRQV